MGRFSEWGKKLKKEPGRFSKLAPKTRINNFQKKMRTTQHWLLPPVHTHLDTHHIIDEMGKS